MINSPFHKHIFYAVHLPQSSVGHQLTQEQARGGKVCWLRTPLFPFQWESLSAGGHRMEECEIKTTKERALNTVFGCSDSDPLHFSSRAGIYFLPELKSTRSGLQNKLHSTNIFASMWNASDVPFVEKLVTRLWEVRNLRQGIMFKVYTMEIWVICLTFPVHV